MDGISTLNKLSSLMTENDLANVANSSPENLIFFSNAELLEDYDDQPKFARIAILAELLVRYSFKRSNIELRNSLCNILSEEVVSNFESWLDCHDPNYDPKPICLLSSDSQHNDPEFVKLLEDSIFNRFEKLYGKCDGIIPVILNDDVGASIPFTLEPIYSDNSSLQDYVVDIDDVSFPQWSEAISGITSSLKLEKKYRLRLFFHSNGVKVNCFSGRSLQFPFLLSYWRKEHLLPTYSPFSIMATGEIDNSRLRPVKTLPKLKCLNEKYDLLAFFCPFSNDIASQTDQSLISIDANTSIDDILLTCQNKIEKLVIEKSAQSVILDYEYIYNRIDAFTIYTKNDLESRWEQIISSLLYIEKKLRMRSSKDVNVYLDCLIALSFAYCHSGKTLEAIQYNQQARNFVLEQELTVKDQNLTAKFNKLLIHQLVLFQDIDDLSSVPKLAKEIYLQITQAKINEEERNDLLMQYHGTMAQIHIYGTLAGFAGFSKEDSYLNAKEAIDYAEKIHSVKDIIRDMNYRHLCDACFIPGSNEEQSMFGVISEYLRENTESLEDKSYNVNLQFQFRQRCLAAYFQILYENKCSDKDLINKKYPSIKEPFIWLKALSYKYLGAVNVFYHNKEKAQKLFDVAIGMMKNEVSPLFKYMTMTIAAEAYRSFSELGDEKTAEEYRQKAKDIFTANGDFITFYSSFRWKDFLNTPWDEFKASGKEFPGLHYYY